MTKRILIAVAGAFAAAVMISAATHAVDFEQSSIEDGQGRFVIAGLAGAAFLTCLYLLVDDMAKDRLGHADSEQSVVTDTRPGDPSLAARLAASRASEQAASQNPDLRISTTRLGLPVRPKDSAPTEPLPDRPPAAEAPAAGRAPSGRGLFGVTPPPTPRPASTNGLFGGRTTERPRGASNIAPDTNKQAKPQQPQPLPQTEPQPLPQPETQPQPQPVTEPSGEPTQAPETRAGETARSRFTESLIAGSQPESVPAPRSADTAPAPTPAQAEPIVLRDYQPDGVDHTVDDHTVADYTVDDQRQTVVDSRVDAGTLTTDAELTPDDIRTKLFAAPDPDELRHFVHAGNGDRGEPGHPDDELPTWHVIDDPAGDADDDQDDPPSGGYLYATGG